MHLCRPFLTVRHPLPHTCSRTLFESVDCERVWDQRALWLATGEEESPGDKEAIHGRRRRCGFGGCERKKEKEESDENECVYTDTLRPSTLNETDSLCAGLKAFRQTEHRDISKETRNLKRERETDKQTNKRF